MKVAGLLQRILPPVWLGIIAAIAMEAQLKFQAPGITRELGLGIGKIVFTALNRVECVIAILLLVTFLVFKNTRITQIIFAAILLVLLAQTFWLIPSLIERIDLITSGQTLPTSLPVHFFYIGFEICKMILLLVLSVLLNWQKDSSQK
jgi:hypothetical protein